ncbi:MAG: hypoxanthine phosphoribosyltransferase [Planctomycetota bacterium]|nr:hypoxanthine phosphoribosyltransferase [Planctomycetota bacterium]MDA1179972.1 hypoxanthine phosphoribosyltransferase [Planctomycetota bacterium]
MKTILTEEAIHAGVRRLATQIIDDFRGERLAVMGVMTGSVVFLADLIRQLDFPLRVGVVWASSYRGSTTVRGELSVNTAMMPNVSGEHVLLIDDIFDTGHTLAHLLQEIQKCGAASVRSAVLLRKQGRREVTIVPDYVAFEIPDEFVVGYGLDYQDYYRHLPYLAALEPDDLAKWQP